MSTKSSADILWSAYIDDHTTKFFVQFNNNLDTVSSRSASVFGNVQVHTRRTGSAIGVLGGVVGGLTAQLLRMGVTAVRQFKAMASNAIMLAARADTLAIALEVVGANVGYSKDELDKLTKSVEANGITTIAARQTLLQLAEANLDLSKAVDLSRVAQDAAIIANINSSEATQRMIHGIVSLNPLILKHMGLYIDLTQEYMDATGASENVANALSTQQKQAIALNAVLKAGTRIDGAYEAAMETAGKQAGSTARFMEQLMVAIGGVAQPAFYEFITRFNQSLISMTSYIENNEDAMRHMAGVLAEAMEFTLDVLETVAEALKGIPPLALEAAKDIMSIWDQDITEPKVITNIKEFIVWWVKLFVEELEWVLNLLQLIVHWIGAMWKALVLVANVFKGAGWADLTKPLEEFGAALEQLGNDVIVWGDDVRQSGSAAEEIMRRWLGLAGDIGRESRKSSDAVVDSLYAISKETEDVIKAIEKLNKTIGKDLAEAAIEAARDAIEEAIRNQQKMEDLARRRSRRLEDIRRRYAQRRADLERDLAEADQDAAKDAHEDIEDAESDHANKLLEIEIEYRRRLEDIRRDFEFEASEAARRNDAVTVARLIRTMNKQIDEAAIERDRDIEDAERDRDDELERIKKHQERVRKERKDDAAKRRADLERDLKRELEEVEIARKRELEDLAISQERERQMKELHRQWDMEDLQRKYDEELVMMGQHWATLEYLDADALQLLLTQHGEYITNDVALWDAYYARLEERAAKAATAVAQQAAYMTSKTYKGGPYPGDPYGMDYYQEGGIGVYTGPHSITVGEPGPELVAAIPLNAVVRYDHNINMSGNLDVNGVSPSAEADLVPAIMGVLAQFGQALMAKSGGIR